MLEGLGLGLGWVGEGSWGLGWIFDWEKVNLLKGIYISSCYIALCLILVVKWTLY